LDNQAAAAEEEVDNKNTVPAMLEKVWEL